MARSSSEHAELPPRTVTTSEVTDLWQTVTRSGGAVGFPVDTPAELIAEAAAHALHEVESGHEHLLTEREGNALLGMVLLRRQKGPVHRHRAEVRKLMVRPERQRTGTGGRLLARAVEHARQLGLRQLLLATRGGTHLPDCYRRQGWTEVGRFPAALHVAPGDFRDEHWFQYDLVTR
ncbi:GNAT family N-acetyltransferase [Saccharopolyspora sp. NFXS83]|uniref:GNAT family N-acetyltransferase n=1 Tax=Saccharopolyspora sp. NFXS83 TaxID=2993560 RepID=UPI00224B7FA0|nr:GNAT family N-acetyltransferase [Saccharopolyspora sp. NFXS83]MCX2729424.1 GNAT family N-acetyltransferase [Saccharopolyspora sp. NFXS83]